MFQSKLQPGRYVVAFIMSSARNQHQKNKTDHAAGFWWLSDASIRATEPFYARYIKSKPKNVSRK